MTANKYIIAMLGEKDHGKSTFIGNLLIATGTASEHRINDAKKYAKSGRFEPAYILDSFPEEREQEMTIDTTRAEIVQDGNLYEFIDVPGHLELIKNMLSGASNGDLAILMVSAKPDEGFQPQTKRHVYLANLLGISSLIVAVNKLDITNYDQKTFERIKREVEGYLKAIGFKKPLVFVPISAYNNENIVTKSEKILWYDGKPMLDLVKEFAAEYGGTIKPKLKALRLFVQDAMDDSESSVVFGTVQSGKVAVGEKIKIEPGAQHANVLELHVKGKKAKSAKIGTNVAMKLDKVGLAKRGTIISSEQSGVAASSFKAKLFLIKELNPKNLSEVMLKFNNNDISIKSIVPNEVISPISGAKEQHKTVLEENSAAVCEISIAQPYLVEKFEDLRELGRFGIFKGNDLVGIGIVL